MIDAFIFGFSIIWPWNDTGNNEAMRQSTRMMLSALKQPAVSLQDRFWFLCFFPVSIVCWAHSISTKAMDVLSSSLIDVIGIGLLARLGFLCRLRNDLNGCGHGYGSAWHAEYGMHVCVGI